MESPEVILKMLFIIELTIFYNLFCYYWFGFLLEFGVCTCVCICALNFCVKPLCSMFNEANF